jgi:hypothetical protein
MPVVASFEEADNVLSGSVGLPKRRPDLSANRGINIVNIPDRAGYPLAAATRGSQTSPVVGTRPADASCSFNRVLGMNRGAWRVLCATRRPWRAGRVHRKLGGRNGWPIIDVTALDETVAECPHRPPSRVRID